MYYFLDDDTDNKYCASLPVNCRLGLFLGAERDVTLKVVKLQREQSLTAQLLSQGAVHQDDTFISAPTMRMH